MNCFYLTVSDNKNIVFIERYVFMINLGFGSTLLILCRTVTHFLRLSRLYEEVSKTANDIGN